jgi:tetratricopeptide (TPR) repeat protein
VRRPPQPLVRKLLLILTCLGTVSIYLGRVLAVYGARSANLATIADLQHDIRWLPDDAELHYLLGLQLSDSGHGDPDAITHLRRATILNPYNGWYWLDLASVYRDVGNVEKEDEAVQFALDAEPGNPEIAAEAAKYFLAAGDVNRALPLFRQSVEQNPQVAESILQACWDETQNANLLLAKVIPDSPELQLVLLRILTGQRQTAAASDVWQYLVTSAKSFDPQLSFFYFDYLLKEHDVTRFEGAWRELAGLSPNLQTYLPNDNLIVNGSFEQQALNAGLDWRFESSEHVTAGIDDEVAHSGTHSLSLTYDGNPAYESGWKQYVPVQSNTDYQFSAWIKSENVTSSSGPRIAIVDAYSGQNLLLTDDVLDTHPWQQITGTVRVPAGIDLLSVKIIRAPTDTRISGRVWIDDMHLAKR